MNIKEIIQNFYKSLEEKSNEWQNNLSDSVVFSDASKTLSTEGREGFIQAFTPFSKGIQHIALQQLIIEDDDACAIVSYTYISPKGDTLQQSDAEVWRIVNGKIDALTIYFDITQYRAFMRG